jgi:CRP-like cAMP-binding protein
MQRFSSLGRAYGDEVVCHQGDRCDAIYVIQEGWVRVFCEDDGVETLVGQLGPGEIVGEMAVFDQQPRSATVRAAGTARVLTLDKRAFLRQIHDDPTVAWRLLEAMSVKIRRLNAELTRLKSV